MSENKMSEVVKLLNVEIGEEFLIFNDMGKSMGKFKFGDKNLWGMGNGNMGSVNSYLIHLFNGDWTIKKLPWKPKEDEHYWTYANRDDDNKTLFIMENIWENDVIDKMFYRLGFCYKTEEEAEADLPRVIKFLNSNDIINWE